MVFFPTNVFITSAVEKDEPGTPAEPSMTKPKLVRLSEAFGTLHHSTVDVSLDDNEYQETDEALQITSAHSIRTVSRFLRLPQKPAADTSTRTVRHLQPQDVYLAHARPRLTVFQHARSH